MQPAPPSTVAVAAGSPWARPLAAITDRITERFPIQSSLSKLGLTPLVIGCLATSATVSCVTCQLCSGRTMAHVGPHLLMFVLAGGVTVTLRSSLLAGVQFLMEIH